MNDRYGYPDDEALEKLITDVELHDMVKAPDRIEQNVLHTIRAGERRVHEFRRYCLQVGLSVAAAVAILVVLPFWSGAGRAVSAVPEKQGVPSKEDVMGSYDIASREEVLAKYDRDPDKDLRKKVLDMMDKIGGSI